MNNIWASTQVRVDRWKLHEDDTETYENDVEFPKHLTEDNILDSEISDGVLQIYVEDGDDDDIYENWRYTIIVEFPEVSELFRVVKGENHERQV